jgi:hypothetical protein
MVADRIPLDTRSVLIRIAELAEDERCAAIERRDVKCQRRTQNFRPRQASGRGRRLKKYARAAKHTIVNIRDKTRGAPTGRS